MIKDILKYFLFSILFGLGLVSCNKDINNVKVEGVVYDQISQMPLSEVELKIENASYDGGDYDSYNNFEEYRVFTDEDGYYSIEFEKSAYVQIDVTKNGYEDAFKGKEVYKKNLKIDFFLVVE